ncbi:MAG TPA: hypothetical protein VGK64_00440 [Bryobacteraceae bacterium]
MHPDLLSQLRACEGKVVRLTSTEGEILSARVLYVSEEDEDVTIDILSTNQPERYVQMGKKYQESAWAIPFVFIAEIGSGDDCD